jgi:acetylornithine deacetylase/succinyl-diaminopimelate desuccinylase family protein
MLSPAALLAELVRRPSVNPMGRSDISLSLVYESRVTDYLEAQFHEIGANYRRVPVAPGRDNLVATYDPPGQSTATILWEAHQDTVPTDGMTVDPFGGRVENGKLYGRGACDVKAGIAAMFAAFARLVKEKPAGTTRVILAFTIDEEHTFLGAQHLVRDGLKADFAIVAEPTQLDLVTSHKGVARWQLETHGVACHSSRPENGVNAVYRMAKLIGGIESYAGKLRTTRPDPVLGSPTLSLGRVEGGTSPNTVPDFCRVDLDRRLIPGESTPAAVADLNAYLKSHPGIDFAFTTNPLNLDCPPLAASNSPWVAQLANSVQTVTGRPAKQLAVPYGTDASTIAEAGIPAVVFGPGDIAQAHTKDEWVELIQVEQAADILFRLATHRE